MTEQSSLARVGQGIVAGLSVSDSDGAADSPYAAVLDWGWTHDRVVNLDSRVGPVEPGAGRRWGLARSSQLSGYTGHWGSQEAGG
jgi:hypothetical protein